MNKSEEIHITQWYLRIALWIFRIEDIPIEEIIDYYSTKEKRGNKCVT